MPKLIMPPSYRDINYALRPAKSIERKMLCEAFTLLVHFAPMADYRYIGLGSTYFSDFLLVHRRLGISDMLSIEQDGTNRERFLFNRPFGCITMRFGRSTAVLPTLRWRSRTIIWLDYDGKLDDDVLADVRHIVSNAVSGSMMVVTVNAEPGALGTDRVTELRNRIGDERFPADIATSSVALGGWNTARAYRRIIANEIAETLNGRNGIAAEADTMNYRQLFNFRYADGARMLTVGGLLYTTGEAAVAGRCGFERLEFTCDGENAYLIEVPNLTFRELRHLEAQLPVQDVGNVRVARIPRADVRRYMAMYRYFPSFVEAEL